MGDIAKPFQVFFDSGCPMCRREIEMLKRKDKQKTLEFIDLVGPGFDASVYGISFDTFMKEIHGRYNDGRWVTGVDVFREIYSRIGFNAPVAISKFPVIRQIMSAGYRVFAYFRYRGAMKRLKKEQKMCGDSCSPIAQSES